MSNIEQIIARHNIVPTSGDKLYRKSDLAWGVRPSAGQNGQAGVIAPSAPGWSGAAFTLTASRAYIARFVPETDFTATRCVFAVTTAAGADDACDVGIYDASLNRLVSKGATTGLLNSTGVKTPTFAGTPLTAGTVYYAAFSVGTFGGTAANLLMTSFGSTTAVQLFGSSAGLAEVDFKASSHPLPATLTVTGGIQNVPVLAVRP